MAIMDDDGPRRAVSAQGAHAYHSDSDSDAASLQGGFVVPMARPAARHAQAAARAETAVFADMHAAVGDDDDVPIDSLAAGGDMLASAGDDADLAASASDAEALFERMASLVQHDESLVATPSSDALSMDENATGFSDGDVRDAAELTSAMQTRDGFPGSDEPAEARVVVRKRVRGDRSAGELAEPHTARRRVANATQRASSSPSDDDAVQASASLERHADPPSRNEAAAHPGSHARPAREPAMADWERALALAAGAGNEQPDSQPAPAEAAEPADAAAEREQSSHSLADGGDMQDELEALQREVAAAQASAKRARKPRASRDRGRQRAARLEAHDRQAARPGKDRCGDWLCCDCRLA